MTVVDVEPKIFPEISSEGIQNWPTLEEQLKLQAPLIHLTPNNFTIFRPIEGNLELEKLGDFYNAVRIPGTNKFLTRVDQDGEIERARLEILTIEHQKITKREPLELEPYRWINVPGDENKPEKDKYPTGIEDPRFISVHGQLYLVAVHTNFYPSAKAIEGKLSNKAVEYREVVYPVNIVDGNINVDSSKAITLPVGLKNYFASTRIHPDGTSEVIHFLRNRIDTGKKDKNGQPIIFSSFHIFKTPTMEELTKDLLNSEINKPASVQAKGKHWLGGGLVMAGYELPENEEEYFMLGHTGEYELKLGIDGKPISNFRRYGIDGIVFKRDSKTNKIKLNLRLLIDPREAEIFLTKSETLNVMYPKTIEYQPETETWYISMGINDKCQGLLRITKDDNPQAWEFFNKHIDINHPDFKPYIISKELADLTYEPISPLRRRLISVD